MMGEVKKVPKLRFAGFSGEWEKERLRNISSFLDGRRRPIKSQDRQQMKGDYPYYGASGIIDYVNDFIFDEDIILLGEDGENILSRNLPLAFKVTGKCWINNHAHVIKPSGEVNIDFLTLCLELINYEIYNTGTAQPKLNQEVCRNIPLLLPTLPEQEKIANFLTAVDAKISNLSEEKSLLEQYKKGAMQKIFSQELRFKQDDGSDFPEWESKRLGEVCECLDNKRQPLNNSERENIKGSYPYWGANNIMDFINKYIFDETIVLLAEDGGNFNEYKTRPIANISFGKCWVNNHTHVLKGRKNKITNEFLYYSLVHKNITGFVSGGTRSKLIKSEMLKIPLIVPTLNEQTKIANFLSSIDEKIATVSEALEGAQAFKKGLLQQLFV